MLATFRIGGVVEWSTSKFSGLTGLESITGQRRLGFLAQIENFRDGHLHPKCGFIRLKTCLEVLIGASGGQVIRIEFGQKFQFEPLLVLGHSRSDVADRSIRSRRCRWDLGAVGLTTLAPSLFGVEQQSPFGFGPRVAIVAVFDQDGADFGFKPVVGLLGLRDPGVDRSDHGSSGIPGVREH